MTTISHRRRAVGILRLPLIATATVAATIGLAANVHADESQIFASPSGNIHCYVPASSADGATVGCQIEQYAFTSAPTSPSPCPDGVVPNDFGLAIGKQATLTCSVSPLLSGYADPWPTLGYGHKRAVGAVGAISCDSEPTGMTCTDSSTGHFFRVSRDSYQLG
jgi:hypothetical protein